MFSIIGSVRFGFVGSVRFGSAPLRFIYVVAARDRRYIVYIYVYI